MTFRKFQLRRKRQTRLEIEPLERRELLDGHGAWFSDSRITISFVPDGTQIGPSKSQLFAEFEGLGEPTVWQETIVRAFQTWARSTPFNVAQVDDIGIYAGVRGNFKGDVRFGDVRVGAIPFETNDVFLSSIAIDDVFQGTWAGDLYFNSNVKVESLDQLFSLALHEAGHIFGTDHNDFPGSPMNVNGPPIATALTEADFNALLELHGLREPDQFEASSGNDPSLEKVASVDVSVSGDEALILYGDIQSATDIDEYRFTGLGDGEILHSIQIVTEGISSLQPTLRVSGTDGVELAVTSGEASFQDGLIIDLRKFEQTAADLVFQVSTNSKLEPYDVGAYSLIVQHGERVTGGDLPTLEPPTFCQNIVAMGRDQSLTPTDIQSELAQCYALIEQHDRLPPEIVATLINNKFTGRGDLGPDPVDPTEHTFCGHDYLADIFSCLVKGDIDGNGQVDFADFLVLSSNFGKEELDREDGDLNGDTKVNFSDFLIVSQQFGKPAEFEEPDPRIIGDDTPPNPFYSPFPFLFD